MSHHRPRVLMLTFEYGPIRCGGLAAMLTSLCQSLDRTRFEPVVVLPRSGHVPAWPRKAHRVFPHCEADIYSDGGCEVWLLSNPLLDGAIYPEPSHVAGIKKIDEYCERTAELLGELRGDLVHLHDAFGYKCLYEARRRSLPSVLTIHRLHDDEPTLAFAELAALRLVDEVTTVSRAYARERQDFFGPREPVHAIPNGIDTAFWSVAHLERGASGRPERLRRLQQRLGLPPAPTFAYVGRLDREQKGLDVLLEAHALLGQGAPPEAGPYNLLFAGEGDPALAAHLTAVASASHHVRFLPGLLSREGVRELLGAVDFAVIPSRFEPFGIIQLEAMALGALPIASRVGGLRDVLIDLDEPGGFGKLFPMGDARALAEALSRMALLARGGPEALEPVRQRALAHVQAYSARAMAARYEQLYTSMLDSAAREAFRHAG